MSGVFLLLPTPKTPLLLQSPCKPRKHAWSRRTAAHKDLIKQQLQTTASRTTQMIGKGQSISSYGDLLARRLIKSFVYSGREEESQEQGRDRPWNCRQPSSHKGTLALLKHLCLLSGAHVTSWAPTSPWPGPGSLSWQGTRSGKLEGKGRTEPLSAGWLPCHSTA